MLDLFLEIVTPSKIIFSGEIKSITVPGTNGSFQVLKNHAPIISSFEVGILKIQTASSKKYYATGGGTIEVSNNKIQALADSLEEVNEIDLSRAENALARARTRLSNINKEKIDIARAEAAMARAMNRIKLVSQHKSSE